MFSKVDWHQVLSLNKSFHIFNVCLLCIHFCNGYNIIPVFIQELQEHFQTSHWLFSRQARDLVILRNGGLNCHNFLAFLYFYSFCQNSSCGLFLDKDFTAKKDLLCPLLCLWGKGHRRSFELEILFAQVDHFISNKQIVFFCFLFFLHYSAVKL